MTADKQLKAYIDRVLRLKEEQDALGDDIREIYAEAKAEGYDKTIMGKIVAHLRKVLKEGDGAVTEQENVFDTYLQAYHRASGTPVATHTHDEKFDRETGELLGDINPRLAKQVVDGMQTEAGRAALAAAVDIMIEREEAEVQNAPERPSNNDEPSPEVGPQAEASPAGTGAGTLADREGHQEGEAASSDLSTNSQSDDDAIAAVKGKARLANVADVEPSSSAPNSSVLWNEWQAAETDPTEDRSEGQSPAAESVGANAGGDHVTAQSSTAATAGALVQVAPATKRLRPLCRIPGDNCGGYGSTHCGSCLRAAREAGVAA